MPSNHLTLCHRLLLPSSIFPSIRVFPNEPVLCIREMQITPARTAVTRKISRGLWCTFSLRSPGLRQWLMLAICTCHFLLILVTALLMETEMRLLFRHSVVSDSLWPHGLQHTRLPCPSPSPGVCSNSCPLNQWCHPTISSSVTPSPHALNLSQHQGLF